MTDTATDDLLSAYLDGQIDPAARAEIETRLAAEPDLAARLEALTAADAAAAGWFADMLGEPPAATVETVRQGFRRRRRGAGAGGGFERWLAPVVAAAAVLLIGAFGFDRAVDRRVDSIVEQLRAERQADLGLIAEAMQQVLETHESGTPVRFEREGGGFAVTILPERTWRSQSGHWCRQFREIFLDSSVQDAPVSIACRDAQGKWRRVKTELPGSVEPPIPLELQPRNL